MIELPNNTLRVHPEDFLNPSDFREFYDHPERPFHIDLGCGMGRFLMARAGNYPHINFLGIDRLLKRIKKIDKKSQKLGLENLRLFRVDGYYATTFLLASESVDAYYIFYPDPWPKDKHLHNRLFNKPFMDAIARTLKPGGLLHTSSDHLPYFEEIYALIKNDSRFEETEPFVPTDDEKSDFELIFEHKVPGRASFIRK